MRIGELARMLNVSADTIRFYERSGLVPHPHRAENGYRDYGPAELERVRFLLDLRRLDLPLDEAARLAGWCQSGHCAETTAELPHAIAAKRAELRARIAGLRALDERLEMLERHLHLAPLPMAGETGICCGAAAIVAADGAAALAPRSS